MTVRIGCLGAARIAPAALVRPARAVAGAEVVAVAARSQDRARTFATKHGIPRVVGSYQELVDDPEIDAVYNPLPNGLHGVWTERALRAGKHVLCEKPFTANATEAEEVAKVAAETGLVVMEAFHWRYHPLAAQLVDIVRGGELGPIREIRTSMCFPLLARGDIRWQAHLAGGALMDAGCYAVHMARTLAGSEPEVTSAEARLRSPGVDRYVRAFLKFPDGGTGRITTSMWSGTVLDVSARVTGEKGSLHVLNPTAPQYFSLVTQRSGGRTRRWRARGNPTYQYQLEAFVDAVENGAAVPTGPDDAVANMRVIDAIYRAAGMEPRQPTPA
ncbi:MAG TPA: Gfo/Idh/MocA family oxidoreductase [Acidimicrobiales bacterium]|nr:Gfo/Idh/MocA family oxidoreductase [Acidimicrobiales bacterium]